MDSGNSQLSSSERSYYVFRSKRDTEYPSLSHVTQEDSNLGREPRRYPASEQVPAPDLSRQPRRYPMTEQVLAPVSPGHLYTGEHPSTHIPVQSKPQHE